MSSVGRRLAGSVLAPAAFVWVGGSAATAQQCQNRGQLDALYCGDDYDLVADTPTDPRRLKARRTHVAIVQLSNIALRVLFPPQGLTPDQDYHPLMSDGHDKSALGVESGDYDMAPVASDVFYRMVARGTVKCETAAGADAAQAVTAKPHLSWSATLAMPAMPQASSCGPPFGAPLSPTPPIVSSPTLIGTPPWSGMTSVSARWPGTLVSVRFANSMEVRPNVLAV